MLGALLVMFSQTPVQSPDGGVPPLEAEPPVHLSAGAEAELGVLSSGWAENGADPMFGLRPMVGMSVGDAFAIQLGPLLRLRLVDTAPLDRPRDIGGVLRGQDWDRLGDFGEILQVLRIGEDNSQFRLRAGPVNKKTLGLGHLLFRYSNRLNADARPAAVSAVLDANFMHFELFTTDLLAGRVYGGEVSWDIARSFSEDRSSHGRHLLALSLAHDFSVGTPAAIRGQECAVEAGCMPPPSTLVHLDVSSVVLRGKTLSLMLLAGMGARANTTRDLGFVLGAAMDVRIPGVELSLRAEARKQAGGFRHGYFGPQYEIARFSGIGFTQTSLANESLPDAVSFFGEGRFRLARLVTIDGAVEAFSMGRTDFDVTANLDLLQDTLSAEARLGAVGLGFVPRWLVTAGFRWRVLPSLYLLASGGTVYFPQENGTLVRGVIASGGLGVDLER